MKKLVRPTEGRVVAGVARGMADYFGIDVVWMRIGWTLLLLPGGLPGILPYFACWLLIPEEP